MLTDFLSVPNILAASVTAAVLLLAHTYCQKGLSKFPGPLLASFTNAWRLRIVWQRNAEKRHIALHKEFGEVVRLGPNFLSFGTPAAIKDIYGLNSHFIKSKFYPIQQGISNGSVIPSLFGTQNERFHAQLRRCVNGAFSMSSLIHYENAVDRMVKRFIQQTAKIYLATEANPGRTCDFARWLQFFAFDVIGTITYSKDHGFLEKNEDIDGIAYYMTGFFDYASVVGQMPFVDHLLWKNPLLLLLNKFGLASSTGTGAVNFAKARMAERLTASTDEIQDDMATDLLNKFLQAKQDHPDFMTDARVMAMSLSMTFAGSETTGISLGAIFYYTIRNPRCYNKLVDEILQAEQIGQFQNDTTISFQEANNLDYLGACIKEAFRIFPAPGLHLERIVPEGGATIAGHQIPGGTVVGCSPWVLHRNPAVFGADIDEFRPERWLEADPASLKTMNASMAHFGYGSRTCLGKNISLLEITKLVPSVLRNFDVQLADPNSEWKTINAWFIRQTNFHVKITKRNRATG